MTALSVEDRLDLLDLVHRYAAYVDERDGARAADLFTEDGVLASPAPPASLDPVVEAVGRDRLAAAFGQLADLPVTVHAVTGVVLDPVGADAARGRVTVSAHHVSERAGEPTDLVWHVRYLDDYRRTPVGWRFRRRELHLDVVESRRVARARGV